jgi:hypothetical protein
MITGNDVTLAPYQGEQIGVLMPKVVYTRLKTNKPSSVTTKRIKTAEGKTITLTKVSANSQTLVDDLTYVFRKNVAKAKRENRILVGQSGRISAKG